MKLFRTKTFKKDCKKIRFTDDQYARYIKYVSVLLEGRELPLVARDHNLIGNYSGFREFHVGGDLLVVYCIENEIIKLTRIGIHSQLFK